MRKTHVPPRDAVSRNPTTNIPLSHAAVLRTRPALYRNIVVLDLEENRERIREARFCVNVYLRLA